MPIPEPALARDGAGVGRGEARRAREARIEPDWLKGERVDLPNEEGAGTAARHGLEARASMCAQRVLTCSSCDYVVVVYARYVRRAEVRQLFNF